MKNILNKALPLMLVFLILITTNAGSITASAAASFKDVKTTAWYYSYVSRLVELKITSGYSDGTYKPDSSVTRAEFITFLCKAAGHQPAQGNLFSDTQKHWASGYIAIALNNGIVDLPADKKFRPDIAITRLEAVEMLCRSLNIAKDTTTKNPYKDVSTADSGYTSAAYTNYLMQGSEEKTGRYFKPSGKLTRAEAAAIIVNAYDYHTDKMAYLNKKVDAEKEKAEKEKTEEQKYQEWLDSIDKGVSSDLFKNTKYTYESRNLYENHQKVMADIYGGECSYWMNKLGIKTYDALVDMYLNNARKAIEVSCNYDYKDTNVLKENIKQVFSYNFNYGTTPDYIKDIVENKRIMESKFYTGKGLITTSEIKQPAVRGTLKYRYLSGVSLPKGKKLNIWYEEDILITFYFESTGLKVHYWEEISPTRLSK
jgi:hypothetical protein